MQTLVFPNRFQPFLCIVCWPMLLRRQTSDPNRFRLTNCCLCLITRSLCEWMDYFGPIAVGEGPDRKPAVEGVTYFDHPANPRFPSYWHVREDGWIAHRTSGTEQILLEIRGTLVVN
ncbi:MAG: PmoA family protein [Planctomycetes bacterium]|nr:PmoA family protein [Planctomycetota bacterium]